MVIDHDTCRSTRDAAYGEGEGDGVPSGAGGPVAGPDGVPAGDGIPLARGDGIPLAGGDGIPLARGDGVANGDGVAIGDGVTNGVAVGVGVGVGVGLGVGGGVGRGVGPHGRSTVMPARWSRQITTGPHRRVVRVAPATSERGITRPAQVR